MRIYYFYDNFREFSKVYCFLVVVSRGIGGTANTFECLNEILQIHIQRVLAVPPIPQGLCQVEINSRVNFEIMIHVWKKLKKIGCLHLEFLNTHKYFENLLFI